VEQDILDPIASYKPVVGVDLGILALATFSDGTRIENPHALKRDMRRLKRLQRVVSRRQKGSANREKAVRQLARAHLRVANVRKNALHQVTSRLATLAPAASAGETKSAVVLEDLNVSGMVQNHHLAQAILDVGFSEFRRQMIYKGQWYGCQVILADRFYPSSKRCSQCGHIQAALELGTRVYSCEHCGLMIDRDLNAAINLEQLTTGSSPERYACGENVSPGYQAVLVEAGTEQQSTLCRHVLSRGQSTKRYVNLAESSIVFDPSWTMSAGSLLGDLRVESKLRCFSSEPLLAERFSSLRPPRQGIASLGSLSVAALDWAPASGKALCL